MDPSRVNLARFDCLVLRADTRENPGDKNRVITGKEPQEPQALGLGLFFKMIGWVPSVGLGLLIYLKSFGSQILDLGLESNKVMRASKVELGL